MPEAADDQTMRLKINLIQDSSTASHVNFILILSVAHLLPFWQDISLTTNVMSAQTLDLCDTSE